MRYCIKCETNQPDENFYYEDRNVCKPCWSAYSYKKYTEKIPGYEPRRPKMSNKEKVDYHRRYYRIHCFARLIKGLGKKGLHTITKFDLWKLAKKQKMLCAISGRKLKTDNISIDHITPLANGGTNKIENLRLTCVEANLAKWKNTDEELLKLCQDIVTFLSPKILSN